MKSSKNVIAILEHFEGYSHVAYLCPAGVWTIGIGTTGYPDGKLVKKGHTCTRLQAEQWLAWDLERFEKLVNKLVKVPLSQNQFDALVSFFYNCGVQPTLVNKINKKTPMNEIWGWFLLFSKASAEHDGKDNDGDGKIDEEGEMQTLAGLLRRRNCEAHLYVLGSLDFYKNIK